MGEEARTRSTLFIDMKFLVIDKSQILDHRPLKEGNSRVRITVGGDRLRDLGDAGFPVTNLLETKILINRIKPDAKKGARFLSADIEVFWQHPWLELST